MEILFVLALVGLFLVFVDAFKQRREQKKDDKK